jgi:hypothetical protein
VREALENAASRYGMTKETMCLIGMVAVLNMAEEAKPELQLLVSSYAKARLELLARRH